jgi:hypothetical protein
MPIDYSRYPANWKTEIVPAVIKRAGNKCENCELDNYQIIYAIKLAVKDDSGRYKPRSLWFRDERDAIRESGYTEEHNDKKYFVKPVKVVLTIAHLDHDETNHDVQLDRLRAWCQLCHLRYDATEKYNRSLKK